MDTERERRIRELAYDLWERDGRPEGGADEYWYEAERRIAGEEARGLREDSTPFRDIAEEESEELPPARPGRRTVVR